jgi:hypothetical protein
MNTAHLSETIVAPGIVRRSDRGLCVAGRKIPLYLIEDYLREGWPPHLLRHWLQLSEQEMAQVVDYLEAHRVEFDREYEEVTRQAAQRERYWREREQERRQQMNPKERHFTPEQAAAWARLKALQRPGEVA